MWFEPNTTHAVVARSGAATASATVTTGQVPLGVATLYDVMGSSSVDRVLHRSPCDRSGAVVISGTDGRLVWYQDVVLPSSNLVASKYTEDGTVLVLATSGDDEDYNIIREIDLYGTELWSVARGKDFEMSVHHDVTKKGGYVYALANYTGDVDGQSYLFDGFYVFGPGRETVATWRMTDHVAVGPAAAKQTDEVDFSHCNSVFVDDAGGILLSCRTMSSLVYVRADWSAPDFGQIAWWLGGDPGAPFANSDLDIVSSIGLPTGFAQQHHASLFAPDRITVFDNQRLGENSRLTSLRLDLAAGEADLDEVYALDTHCSNQGAFYRTPAGRAFGTCPDVSAAYEFAPGQSTEPVFTMTATCATGESRDVYRFVPLHVRQ